MATTKKILWVKAGGFLPLDAGGKIRSYNIVRELARSYPVVAFTFYPAQEHDENPLMAEVVDRTICTPLKLPQPRSVQERLRYVSRFFTSQPFAVQKYCRENVRNQVRQLITSEHFDVVICDFLVAAGVVPWDIPIPKILFTHNVEATIWRRLFDVTRNPVKKLAYGREWWTTNSFEKKILRRADHVLTVSDTDRETLSTSVAPARMTTIPTGVDTQYFRSANRATKRNSLVFTGSMDWMPNEDGILYFLQRILPLVQRSVPDVNLTIVGRRPSPALRREMAKVANAVLTGRVDDVRPSLDEAAVCIVPLRAGSGTRLKIFEAMAMGKPVVSTSIGAEGLPVTDGRELLIADDPIQFASAVVLLLKDAALRSSIGRSARELVERKFSWSAAAAAIAGVIESLPCQPRAISFSSQPAPQPSFPSLS